MMTAGGMVMGMAYMTLLDTDGNLIGGFNPEPLKHIGVDRGDSLILTHAGWAITTSFDGENLQAARLVTKAEFDARYNRPVHFEYATEEADAPTIRAAA